MAHYSPQKPLSHALSSSVPVSGDVKTEALITEATDMDATSDPIMEGANSSLVIGTSDAPVDIQAEVLAVDPDVKEQQLLEEKTRQLIFPRPQDASTFPPTSTDSQKDLAAAIIVADVKLAPTRVIPRPEDALTFPPAPADAQKDLTTAIVVADVEPAPTRVIPRPEDALTSPPAPACTQKDLTAPIVVADVELAPTWRYSRMPTWPRVSGSRYHSRHRWPELAPPSPRRCDPSFAPTPCVSPRTRRVCANVRHVSAPCPRSRACGGLGDCAAHASPAARQNFHRHSPGSRPIRRAPPPPPAPLRSLRAPLSRSTTAGSVGDSAFGAPVTNRPKLAFFSYAGRRSPPPFSTGGDDENAVGLLPPLFLSFCRSPWFLCTSSSTTSLLTGFSRTDKLDSLALFWTTLRPDPPHPYLHHTIHDPHMSTAAAHDAKKAEFFVKRAAQPFAREGPGSCYNVACVKDADIVLYRDGVLTGVQLLERMVWKVGHTNDIERRQGEYGRCDKGQTHIWVCHWMVARRCYCERFAQLQQLCDGGELVIEPCPGCKRRHREYYDFRSVGGFKQFTALMNKVITTMGEVPSCVFFDRPSDDTSDIYDLILQS
ncbi:hypothetical protein B0H11DRAFT_2252152 [Mycena galericulata]|nr:hypothetical protein B0H11DRAFT_2252152 [Mycena galericulata]